MFCSSCGKELSTNSKFCNFCDQKVDTFNQKNINNVEAADRCPCCDSIIKAFATSCSACGYEIRNHQNLLSVKDFMKKLEDVEKQYAMNKKGVLDFLHNTLTMTETDKKKISIITSYVPPNTKEELFEFFVIASTHINMNKYNIWSQSSETEVALTDAWKAKFEQTYAKAKISFGNQIEFENFESIYVRINNQISEIKKKNMYSIIAIILFFVLFIIVILLQL